MNAIGIDPSLTGLAVCVLNGDQPHEATFGSKASEFKTLGARISRFRGQVNSLADWLRKHAPGPGVICLEGYSFGSQNTKAHQTGEFGMYLRCKLLMDGYTVVEVSPAVVKRFATGKGNGKKAPVLSALAKRYGREFDTDDQADAFALAMLCGCMLGAVKPQTAFQTKAADDVRKLYVAEQSTKPW